MDFLLRRLVRKARRGDREAFRKLYGDLYPRVRGYAGRRAASGADADDLTARVFHRLLENLGSIDPAQGVVGWALRTARNLIVDDARARRPGVPLDEAELVESRTPLAELLGAERRRIASERLGALPAADRELLALRYGEGLSHREIAQLLESSEAAVRQRCSRALREVRASIAREKGALAHD